MLVNASTAIVTTRVLLVPYEAKHVATYHEWMKDEEIQVATASEPLSLEEEYQMQETWRRDDDKLTFIICHPEQDTAIDRITGMSDAPERLVGDINLFLSVSDEDDLTVIGEIELMVAQRTARRKGMGREALLAFVKFIVGHQKAIIEEFQQANPGPSDSLGFLRVRVGSENHGSLKLFQSVGFKYLSEEPNVFGEVELRTSADLQGFLEKACTTDSLAGYKELDYCRQG